MNAQASLTRPSASLRVASCPTGGYFKQFKPIQPLGRRVASNKHSQGLQVRASVPRNPQQPYKGDGAGGYPPIYRGQQVAGQQGPGQRVPSQQVGDIQGQPAMPVSAAAKNALAMGTALRNIGWLSFWAQLTLTIVASGILIFSTGIISQNPTELSFIDVCTLGGLVTSMISTFLAWTYIRAGRKLGQLKEVKLQGVVSTILTNGVLNLAGMGATILGLQASIGGLVGKTLTSASAAGYAYRTPAPPPVALDVFSIQASTNTLMAHFVAILFGNWLLRTANKFLKQEEDAAVQDFDSQYAPTAPPLPGY
uniref:Protein TIC 21, chloroplastic n=1 Tax=Auxenochlorella protothecoides TaxID=3075 RepID=A0A1D2A1H8_AUXPR